MRSLPVPVTSGEEVRSYQFWKSVRTEFLCSMLFVLTVTGASLDTRTLPPKVDDHVLMTVIELKMALLYVFAASGILFASSGHFPGQGSHLYICAHLSPNISIAFALVREMTAVRTLMYITVQLLGSLLACSVVLGLTKFDGSKFELPTLEPLEHLPASNQFGCEFLAAFVYTLVYLRATDILAPKPCATNGHGGSNHLIESNGHISGRMFYIGCAMAAAHMLSVSTTSSLTHDHVMNENGLFRRQNCVFDARRERFEVCSSSLGHLDEMAACFIYLLFAVIVGQL